MHELGDSVQANCTMHEEGDHADRDRSFEPLTCRVPFFLAQGDPVICVDAKKNERAGDSQNNGRAQHLHREAEQVRVDTFPLAGPGWEPPSGISDVARHAACVPPSGQQSHWEPPLNAVEEYLAWLSLDPFLILSPYAARQNRQ